MQWQLRCAVSDAVSFFINKDNISHTKQVVGGMGTALIMSLR